MQSPYDILGVKPTAKNDEIRKAYRRLAKQCHPDMRPGDKEAETRFKDISAAYDLLSDATKRKRFDRGEIDAEGRERFAHAHAQAGSASGGSGGFSGGPGGFHFTSTNGAEMPEGMDDLLSHLFGGARQGGFGAGVRRRGDDLQQTITIDFIEAALGGSRRIILPDHRSLDVTIPAGLHDGQTLRLKGQGGPGHGGPGQGAQAKPGIAGDLLLTVKVKPHKLFRREGDDIHVEIPVTLGEAVGGGRIPVPTLTGTVTVTVPPRSNSGTVLRLKGKGIRHGDQYVTLKLVLPPSVDDELARFVAEWSSSHPHDPRQGLT